MKHHNTQPNSVHEHQRPPSITWAAGEACAHQRATTNHRKDCHGIARNHHCGTPFQLAHPRGCHDLAGRNPNRLSGSVEGTGSTSGYIASIRPRKHAA